MIRAQIYLTENERQKLYTLSHETGKSQSELIREAIDQFVEIHYGKKQNKLAALRAAKGLWAERVDLFDFAALRKELDRGNKEESE